MISHYLMGNAQTIGAREVQNNYFSAAQNGAGDLLAVLADGTIDHPNGRIAAIMAVGYCINTFTQKFSRVEPIYTAQFLLDTALKANRRVQDNVFIGKSPRLSLTMALFRGNELNYFNVGVNRIFLYNGHNEQVLGGGVNTPYAEGRCELADKNVIGILSAGAYADAHPMERIRIMASKKKLYDKAQAMIESVSKKRLTIQLNATALLIEVAK